MEENVEKISYNLEMQLSELEMLNSMFPNDGELKLSDPGAISDIQDFLAGKCSSSDLTTLSFTIHLTSASEVKMDVVVVLPILYPEERANVSIHSERLDRTDHININKGLEEFHNSLELGTLCVGSLVEWVQENIHSYISSASKTLQVTPVADRTQSRLWIQSHHIYSKTKIKNIEDWAKELSLNGFILPGKPGFVCVEGMEDSCQFWWQRVRAMNWQKISCRLEEKDSDRKFKDFSNIVAQVKSGEESDMKAFLNYLKEHESSHVFKELFGFDGK